MPAWFVYVARCSDGSLYTGIATDVPKRLAAHDAGRGARYTRGRGPLTLCAVRRCRDKTNALRLELAVKGLSRSDKERLVGDPARFRALAAKVSRRARARAQPQAGAQTQARARAQAGARVHAPARARTQPRQSAAAAGSAQQRKPVE